MALLETQPEWDGTQPKDNADSEPDDFALLLCRLNIERLLEEAKTLGELVVVDSLESELAANVTKLEPDERLLKREKEYANFFVIDEEGMLSYRVRHDIFTERDDSVKSSVRKETWLSFDTDDSNKARFNKKYSNYNAYLNPGAISYYKIEGHYPDLAHDQDEKDKLRNAEFDVSSIKTYQLEDIKDLAIRALDAVRARALHKFK